MSKDLIFEIGCEELPASVLPRALNLLESALRKHLSDARLGFKDIRALGTPRRLALIAEDVQERQENVVREIKGPQKQAAFGPDGKPSKALEGFMRSQGISQKDIRIIQTEKGEYVLATKKIQGEDALKVLPEVLVKTVSTELFPKSMRWGAHDIVFARPIHWLLALYGNKTIGFSYGHVKSSSTTRGHRFMKDKKSALFKPDGVSSYLSGLKERKVMLDPEERKRVIEKGLIAAAKEVSGRVLQDNGLVEEVAFLVEWPVVVRGAFDREFLSLPSHVVVNAMREHQRYFSVVDEKGALLPYFLTVANTDAKDIAVVRKGNERVLMARLNDAKFYFEKDIKTPLKDMAQRLKGVVFQSKLGTSFEKVERFTRLAVFMGNELKYCDGLDALDKVEDFFTDAPTNYPKGSTQYNKRIMARASLLCKADLTSGMVLEFPKLQGIMGSVYAERGGESPEVVQAIYEHYQPIASGSALPASLPGAIISIADKLDTIAGCFSVGLIPTGAQDPYALRRQALGIIEIILDKGFSIPLDTLVDMAINLLEKKLLRDRAKVKEDVLEFFKERLKHKLLSQDMSFDSIDAVFSTDWFVLPDAIKRIHAIEDFKKHPACPALVTAFKRVSNILKGTAPGVERPDERLFKDKEDAALLRASGEAAPKIAGFLEKGDYKKALETLASIKDEIDSFFDHVMVMAEDEKLRTNRLRLLNSIRGLYIKIADISRLTAGQG